MSACLFCQINQTNKEFRFSDEHLFVIDDINPQAPFHQLVIPKKHIATLNDLSDTDHRLVGHLFQIAKQQAAAYGVEQSGYRTVFNCNEAGGQAIYHIHLHVLGGRTLRWPPG